MKSFIALSMIALTACATVKRPQHVALVPVTEQPENNPLPPTPWQDVPGNDENAVGLTEGTPAPFSGVLLSEEKGERAIAYKSRYTELRALYEADRAVWDVHRMLYENQLELYEQKIYDLQPGWWGQHKAEIGIIFGIVLGSAGTIALAKALHGL